MEDGPGRTWDALTITSSISALWLSLLVRISRKKIHESTYLCDIFEWSCGKRIQGRTTTIIYNTKMRCRRLDDWLISFFGRSYKKHQSLAGRRKKNKKTEKKYTCILSLIPIDESVRWVNPMIRLLITRISDYVLR